MMKKYLLFAAGVLAAGFLTGCSSAYVNNYGFGSTMPGMIYNSQTKGNFMLPKMQSMKDVEILGHVEGRSTSTNILLLAAIGDCGIEAAKKDALKDYPQADDIVNVEVDTIHRCVMCVCNTSTTVLRGIAIKYKR